MKSVYKLKISPQRDGMTQMESLLLETLSLLPTNNELRFQTAKWRTLVSRGKEVNVEEAITSLEQASAAAEAALLAVESEIYEKALPTVEKLELEVDRLKNTLNNRNPEVDLLNLIVKKIFYTVMHTKSWSSTRLIFGPLYTKSRNYQAGELTDDSFHEFFDVLLEHIKAFDEEDSETKKLWENVTELETLHILSGCDHA